MESPNQIRNAWCHITAIPECTVHLDQRTRNTICRYIYLTLLDIFELVLENNNIPRPPSQTFTRICLRAVFDDTTVPGLDWLKHNLDQYIPYIYPEVVAPYRKDEYLIRDYKQIYDWLKEYYIH